MDLTVRTHWSIDEAVIICSGSIVHGKPAERWRSAVAEAMAARSRVLLDLASVTCMDAGGVGTLALMIGEASRYGCCLAMTDASARVRALLRLTRLEERVAWKESRRSEPMDDALSGRPALPLRT